MIAVTLVCCYAACWGPTKTRGIDDVRQFVFLGRTVIADVDDLVDVIERSAPRDHVLRSRLIIDPLHFDVVTRLNASFDTSATVPLIVGVTSQRTRCYYFWFFGYVVKLPFERELPIIY